MNTQNPIPPFGQMGEVVHRHPRSCWPGWRVGVDAPHGEHWSRPGTPVLTARICYDTRHVPGRVPPRRLQPPTASPSSTASHDPAIDARQSATPRWRPRGAIVEQPHRRGVARRWGAPRDRLHCRTGRRAVAACIATELGVSYGMIPYLMSLPPAILATIATALGVVGLLMRDMARALGRGHTWVHWILGIHDLRPPPHAVRSTGRRTRSGEPRRGS